MLGEDKQICLSLATHKRKPLFCLNRILNWPGYSPFFKHLFTRDESIDFDILKKEVDWLFERGANGDCHGYGFGNASTLKRGAG